MTEVEWMACVEPTRMLADLRARLPTVATNDRGWAVPPTGWKQPERQPPPDQKTEPKT